MSSAFVKEPDGEDVFEDLPDRPVSPFPNFVTTEGLARIDAGIAHARDEMAAAQKSEDRGALVRAARDLRYWTARRSNAELVEPVDDSGHVRFGSTVTIDRDDGRRQTFRIVGEDEAEPSQGTLSHASPMARALMGKGAGDVATVGDSDIEIVSLA